MHRATIVFSLVSLILFVSGYLLVKKSSKGKSKGGDAFVQRKKKRALGQLCVMGGIVSLGLGITTQAFRKYADAAPEPAGYLAKMHPVGVPVVSPPVSKELMTHATAEVQAPSTDKKDTSLAPETSLVSQFTKPDKDFSPEATTLIKGSASLAPKESPSQAVTPAPVNTEKPPHTLDELTAYILKHPESVAAYVTRGNIYSNQKKFDLAEQDYKSAQAVDANNTEINFNLAENDFRQKNYDAARPGFVALESDIILGDLAVYKVYLCDLFGGHDEQAAKELDALNQVGDNASYYFANIASCVYRGQKEEAKPWIYAADKIYSRNKMLQYSFSLLDLGYLPLSHSPKPGEAKETPTSK